MTDLSKAGTFRLGDRDVNRMGYGAMQLAGPGVFGPPKDHDAALAVLRAAIGSGVNHIDTSDYYGPHVTNRIIREALRPYPANLTIVTKLGAVRGDDGSWLPAFSPDELERGVHDNLENLGIEAIDVVNLRIMGSIHAPSEGTIAKEFSVLARLREQGLIRHLGISNATATQVREAQGIAYVPFVPLGGFSPVQSELLNEIAAGLGATPMQVALAWLLQRSPNILLIPGTSSLGHLAENLAAAELTLSAETVAALDAIGA